MQWVVKPLKDLCSIEKGAIGITKAKPGHYPLVTLAEERKEHNEYQFDTKAVIIPLVSSTGHGHASLKRIHYQEGKFAVGTILCAVIPRNENELHPLFLYHYLDVFKERLLVPLMRGMANVTLPMKSLGDLEIPVPPIEDQLQWVEKFKLVNQKETKLLTELTHQQTLLKQLRQAILQEAVQGKLTEQWRKENSEVEPATVLLEKIKAEKARLVKEKKIKKQKPLPPISQDKIPFELPEGWIVEHGIIAANYIDPQPSHRTPPEHSDGIPYIAMKDITVDGTISFLNARKVSKKILDEHKNRYQLRNGDFIFGKIGTIGKPVRLPQPFNYTLSANLILIQPNHNLFLPEFLFLYMSSPIVTNYLTENRSTMSYPVFGMKKARLMPIPFLPLSEQQAIVEKVESLLAKVSQLEEEVQQNQQQAEQLLQSVLREMMQPNTAQPKEKMVV